MVAQKRQERAEGGRAARVNIRMTADDSLRLTAAAERAGLSLPAYLVESGLRAGNFDTKSDRDAAVYEVIKLERQVARIGNNVNQIAHRLNALGEVDPGLAEVARDVRMAMRAVQNLATDVGGMGSRR